ncbi:DUF4389 domain-containing protein [Streptomyces sp. HUAS TT7]|uniref:DUF4389 domain-containing protein n=1 Tax=Streptomyces sp. HUAS TT7 TaxID=3447507 RepID=UPI003F657137
MSSEPSGPSVAYAPPAPPPHPVTLTAVHEPGLSRWLWLVKWLLALPHFLILVLLTVAFVAVTVVAFFAILITGRYPRPLFDFNVGVMRWSWRVSYYAYGTLGTDRYPPFTVADVAGYPAHLDVAYPERLSRGLVLVKWWLLAIPQYVLVMILAGGVRAGESVGLVAVLTFFAGVSLLFTGRYPTGMYDLNVGIHRWVARVAAYAALMTDTYPPFRLDQGPNDPH